jgi:hypothetical protein
MSSDDAPLTFEKYRRWSSIVAHNYFSRDAGRAPLPLWKIVCLVLSRKNMSPQGTALLAAHLVGEFMVDASFKIVTVEELEIFLDHVHCDEMNLAFEDELSALGFSDVPDLLTRHAIEVDCFYDHFETGFAGDSLFVAPKFMPSWREHKQLFVRSLPCKPNRQTE